MKNSDAISIEAYADKLWKEFQAVSFNNNDELEVDFYHWEKGSSLIDVERWVDNKILGRV